MLINKRLLPSLIVLSSLLPAAASQPAETFWQMLLRWTGISATPKNLKGPEDRTISGGEIRIANVNTRSTRGITGTGGYRSPIFLQGDQDLLALKSNEVIKIQIDSREQQTLLTGEGIDKLIGFNVEDPDKILILYKNNGGQQVAGVLSLQSKSIEPLNLNGATQDERASMLNHLEDWERDYGEIRVYTKVESKGGAEWSDVYIQQDSGDEINLSKCRGVNCGQPSLSHDHHSVVFIRARP